MCSLYNKKNNVTVLTIGKNDDIDWNPASIVSTGKVPPEAANCKTKIII